MSKNEIAKFKCRIKVSARVYQDHFFARWPDLAGGKADPDLTFEAEGSGDHWWLRAPGYGVHGKNQYGNGAIGVWALDDLLISDNKTRQRIYEAERKKLAARKTELLSEVEKLNKQIAKYPSPTGW